MFRPKPNENYRQLSSHIMNLYGQYDMEGGTGKLVLQHNACINAVSYTHLQEQIGNSRRNPVV